ncbi:MAG TPA: cryptochrome/photolyase family protein [Saprospiraceae bacterium]|nr:cryptochrome/photolyase family protein [Saprospiraceae bacterium]
MPKTLRLILGDQLNPLHTWFQTVDSNVCYCMFEMKQETIYVKHHIQKIVAFFLAMRDFAKTITQNGHNVIYFKLDDSHNLHDLTQNLAAIIQSNQISKFEYMIPDEYRLFEQLKEFSAETNITCEMFDSQHFLSSPKEFVAIFNGKKTFLLETFYRHIRKKYQILMDKEGQPIGQKWNFDSDNRKKLAKNTEIPNVAFLAHDCKEILDLLNEQGVATIGHPPKDDLSIWPTNREESLLFLEEFIHELLPFFGDYQDAMTTSNWHLFHSRLSFSLNTKMIHPLEVVNRAVEAWIANSEKYKLSGIEGFIRQIIGWREYMRCIYWVKMPEYKDLNFLDHQNTLPSWYWTGDTKMKCLSHAITQSLDHAYAHHIQRLMVTGNFALLAGIHPDEVDQWYLGIYIDAIEWVEITNTRGMSQYADGGIVGTKPYVSTANYIDKMSDYCGQCHYNKKLKIGDKACPFNSLYWHFYDRHKNQLSNNPRIGMAYVTWNKTSASDKEAILQQANAYLNNLETL